MSSAAESFVVTLGRAAGLASYRYLRDLQPADQDDVIATALLWCWENRNTYTPNVSLEMWFMAATRHAVRDWRRGEAREASELVSVLAVPDDTSSNVEVLSAVEKLLRSLTDQECEIASLRAQGFTRKQIREKLGISYDTYKQASKRTRKLKVLIPEPSELKRVIRTPPAPDTYEGDLSAPSSIDKAVEEYLHPVPDKPTTYADDFQTHDRERVPCEDIRGKSFAACFAKRNILDYEGNPPNRRLQIGDRWYSEAHFIGDVIV
jgi:RNA polymerase sigma factor (sigma-70 family)